ncbi:LOW QUALITY PROTEIN: hypothetical protein PHPALM_30737 [Phytophthora palmivora]|uniref:HAT C-terminal dimerisation domain-containing protein n=1 Tax=Phytophthora palmivora TaxID=4796 RepID=A0A2P4X4C9_9STRA|nr:LOW QUALITY PROTEIN: hypothetical protein PHPALM_30737 [Phytophthora palmivora]
MHETSFILEAQMCLHPVFENPERGYQLIIDRANPHLQVDEQTVQRNVDKVKEYVRKCVVSLMLGIVVAEADTQHSSQTSSPSGMESMFGEDPAPREQSSGHEGCVEEEYDRWLTDTVTLERKANGKVESILEFWKRQEESSTYHYLPRVARILFAVPSSSVVIERDFGVSGMMTTTHRTSLSNHNMEMCSFLNRNREFTDETQCKIFTEEGYANAVHTNMLVALEPSTDGHSISPEWELQLLASFWDDYAKEESKDDHDYRNSYLRGHSPQIENRISQSAC